MKRVARRAAETKITELLGMVHKKVEEVGAWSSNSDLFSRDPLGALSSRLVGLPPDHQH